MKDYYSILGVDRNAAADEIKQSILFLLFRLMVATEM
jgi:curved DNA-binding protein CbpA